MADAPSLGVINEKILQLSAEKTRLEASKSTLESRITLIDDRIAVIDSTINDLQATSGAINTVPAITNLDLSSVVKDSTGNTLTVYGTGFLDPDTVILLNGLSQSTTYVSSTELTCSIPDALAQTIDTIEVQVYTPAPGGGTSSILNLQVVYGAPSLNVITPNDIPEGSVDQSVTLEGINFYDESEVLLNGVSYTPTLVLGDLVVDVPDALLTTAGVPVTVVVRNPTPGGGSSAAMLITVS